MKLWRHIRKPIDPTEGAWAGHYGNLDNLDGRNSDDALQQHMYGTPVEDWENMWDAIIDDEEKADTEETA